LKGSTVIDRVAACDVVAFDKTGTLTEGKLGIEKMIPLNSESLSSYRDVLRWASSLEQHAVHPIAGAFVEAAQALGELLAEVENVHVVPGEGVFGEMTVDGLTRSMFIGGVDPAFRLLGEKPPSVLEEERQRGRILAVFVVDSKEVYPNKLKNREFANAESHGFDSEKTGPLSAIGAVFSESKMGFSAKAKTDSSTCLGIYAFVLQDVLRSTSKIVVRDLKDLDKHLVLLTGDNAKSAQLVAKSLGIDEVQSELTPEQKMETVATLSAKRGVLMVGDGINDAPALARSTVGVSMGQLSSATAREASDVVLLRNDLSLLVWLFGKADQTRTIVRQNVSLAILSMIVGVSTALQGVLPLWMAVTIHEGSTLLVGLNALRLLAL
jgi:Cd2+/Zn2+-exporting ATPase